ncbi:MAG TPA: ATP-binding protein [Candidatus Saccharimonadales bacterium]|nr:ATP-binding protein [Candidatus Saccharimonadales bacterium]
MDHFRQFQRKLQQLVFGLLIAENLLLLFVWWLSNLHHSLSIVMLVVSLVVAVGLATATAMLLSKRVTEPLLAIWQTVWHLSPTEAGTKAPEIEKLSLGRELVTSLAAQIYQFADVANETAAHTTSPKPSLNQNFVAQNLPLPLFIMDAQDTVIFANTAAAEYIGMAAEDLVGKNVYMVLDMSFPSNDTLDDWLKQSRADSATASSSWERVRLNVRDNHPARLFDLAAYYNRDNPEHNEVMLALFDHTKQYSQDDQAISFIALTVHELRTPLTLLRGYIEVFEDEIDTAGQPELANFMDKMHSQAEQLMSFVNNILNVARVDDDQLQLHLQKGEWPSILKKAVQDLSLRAKVRGITLNCKIATGLPAVGVDAIGIVEVVNNLVDNAIKYSGQSTTINIESKINQEGLVETTIQDFGLGIGSSIMPNLFTKFYRDHRNRAQIGGTGLGLYLSKAIIQAHGGNLWVRSKEGEGSTFGFTLLPYDQISEASKQSGNQEITRTAHGWIKNHSLYRR